MKPWQTTPDLLASDLFNIPMNETMSDSTLVMGKLECITKRFPSSEEYYAL